jgi:uncharacterized protein YbjT (DUF2867 family)
MKVALFGATGGTGIELLKVLLRDGTAVRSLVRDADKIPAELRRQPSLSLVQGNARDPQAVAETTAGADVVIVTLGGPTKGPGVDICSAAQVLINEAVNRTNPDAHLICISSIGVGDHYQHCGIFAKLFASYVIPDALRDKDKQERLCREQLKNWTIVRPGGLVDEPGTGKWLAAIDACGWYPVIPRADVAAFVVSQCMPPTNAWLRQSVALVSTCV